MSTTHATDIADDNTVYIGKKFFMRYVMAVLMKFNYFKHDEVIIKARGKNISKATLVAEVVRNTFHEDVKYKLIAIGSVYIESSGIRKRISSIKIVLTRF